MKQRAEYAGLPETHCRHQPGEKKQAVIDPPYPGALPLFPQDQSGHTHQHHNHDAKPSDGEDPTQLARNGADESEKLVLVKGCKQPGGKDHEKTREEQEG